MLPLPPPHWIELAAARLLRHWPHLPAPDADDAAIDVWKDPRWRQLPPERAAEAWLSQAFDLGAEKNAGGQCG